MILYGSFTISKLQLNYLEQLCNEQPDDPSLDEGFGCSKVLFY